MIHLNINIHSLYFSIFITFIIVMHYQRSFMVINFTEATYRPSVFFFFYILSYTALLLPFVIHVFFEFLFISLCFSSPSYAAFLFIYFPASISSMFLFYFNSMPFFVRRFILRRLTNTVPRTQSFICLFFKSSSFSNSVFANLTAGYGTATDVTIH